MYETGVAQALQLLWCVSMDHHDGEKPGEAAYFLDSPMPLGSSEQVIALSLGGK